MVGDALPIKAELTVSARSLLTAVAYGLLVSLLFTLWPLGRAEQVRAGVLFRDEVAPERVLPRLAHHRADAGRRRCAGRPWRSSRPKRALLAFYYCLGVIGVFAVFLGLGTCHHLGARGACRGRAGPSWRWRSATSARPAASRARWCCRWAPACRCSSPWRWSIASIVDELTEPPAGGEPQLLRARHQARRERRLPCASSMREAPAAKISEAPMLRGRLVKLGDRPAEQVKAPPEAQWVLNGDRGLSYSRDVPEGSTVVAGQWWPADYDGEPLVSFEADIAKGLGLKIGDTVTVNVLGRNVTARIANLREVKWESLALNFVMVFSPNTLAGAPHNLLATITLPKDAPLAAEAKLAQQIGRAFPAIHRHPRQGRASTPSTPSSVAVMMAVRAAGSVTLLAGALVLAGALATAQRRRIQQAVILKTLGATAAAS